MRVQFTAFNAVIWLLTFVTTTTSIANARDSVGIDQYLREANGYYSVGNLDRALILYKKCLNQDPNQPDCLCNLASLLLDIGNSEEAELYYRRALEVTDSKHAGALYNLALMLQDGKKEGDQTDARDLYMKLLEIEPKNAEAWANIGAVLHQLGELRLAIASYMKAINFYSASDSEGGNHLVLSSLNENVGRATLRLSEQITDNNADKKILEIKAINFLEAAIAFNPHNEVISTHENLDYSLM